ncbi:MAG: formimidoylglutamate deiminase [Ramlibacter sp.]|nr:formimidoylglutamate deiminase [Ramlibacter sp.]
MGNKPDRFFAARAWIDGAWARDVLLEVDAAGRWCTIQAGVTAAQRAGAAVLDGPVLPGLVDAHSHAFQRAIAGLTERAGSAGAADDFWSWRDRMYSAALRITPGQLESIAAFLYAELLAGGYTQVCDFHYLHNAPDGRPYADPLEMSLALVRAAQRVGMGLTLLPTLYMRAGFGQGGLRDDQRRFASTPDSIARLVEGVQRQAGNTPAINLGVAIHSLRAADPSAIAEVAGLAARSGLPVHIHVSEQVQEVRDCVAHTGQRPIEWLLANLPMDARWNLVHATQAEPDELAAVRASGASIVLCPSTEANLGDGVFDLAAYAAGHWSIGSDSHVTRSWPEELRLLEYSQRLVRRKRNVAAAVAQGESSAAVLFEAALAGGAAASGQPVGAVSLGRRADFVVLDAQSPALLGVPADHLLDALVFSSPDARFKDVYVAGRRTPAGAVTSPAHELAGQWAGIAQDFARTMRELWSS